MARVRFPRRPLQYPVNPNGGLTMNAERITAGEVQAGDVIGYTRAQTLDTETGEYPRRPMTVTQVVDPGGVSLWIHYTTPRREAEARIRPRRTTKLWRVANA